MSSFPRVIRVLLVVLSLAWGAWLQAEPPTKDQKPAAKKPTAGQFIRLERDAQKQPTALQTAIVRYVPASGEGDLTVDLVGVVHVGDKAYYKKLNKQLQQYDVVLYELVAPEGTRIPKGGRRSTDNPLALIQKAMTAILDLELQTEQIDYTKKHFVHADLSPEGMAKAMRKRGEDGFTLFLGIAADLLRQQNAQQQKADEKADQDEEPDVLGLLMDPQGPAKLKKLMAQQLSDLDSPMSKLGSTLTNLLVSDRNEAALKVFQKEMAKGKKKIAIFYGAAHMPDFDKRLKEEYGLKRSSEQWLSAWDLTKKSKGLEETLLKLLLDR
jgi:hypothetical protein